MEGGCACVQGTTKAAYEQSKIPDRHPRKTNDSMQSGMGRIAKELILWAEVKMHRKGQTIQMPNQPFHISANYANCEPCDEGTHTVTQVILLSFISSTKLGDKTGGSVAIENDGDRLDRR